MLLLKKKDLAGALSIAITADNWTWSKNLAYMAIPVCFISEEWKLVSNTISVRILVCESLKEALIELLLK